MQISHAYGVALFFIRSMASDEYKTKGQKAIDMFGYTTC